MEFTPIKPTVLKWGLYTGLAAAAYTIFLYASESMDNTMLTMLLYVISIGGVILTLREYKGLNEGFMPFNTGFKSRFPVELFGWNCLTRNYSDLHYLH